MAYGLRDTHSVERLMDLVVSVGAALGARPETEALVAPWQELKGKLRAERDTRDAEREAVVVASARVRLRDAEWDDAVGDLSGRAFLAAGKDAGAAPYAPLFGAVRAADARRLGAHKATLLGRRLVTKARELAHPDLGATTDRLAAAGDALAAADAERAAAQEKAALHDLRRRALIRELETAAARTEIELLTRFPGRRDLVHAVLTDPNAARRAGAGAAPEDDTEPEAPPADPTTAPA